MSIELEPPPDDLHDSAPPNDRAAEVAVLGAMLQSRDQIAACSEILTGRHFYYPKHERIFDAIVGRYARLEPVDYITLSAELERTGDLDRVGGASFIHELVQSTPVVENATYYADRVREQASLRRFTEAGTRILQMGRAQGAGDVADLVARAVAYLDDVDVAVPGVDVEDKRHPWQPVDIAAVLDGDVESPRATIGTRRDGQCLLYPGAVHSIAGEPSGGKTWFGLIIGTQELEHGHDFAIIDFEDRAETHVGRLSALGATPEQLRTHLRYVRPDVPLDASGWAHLADALTGCRAVIIDGVTEAMTLHGLEVNDNGDVARWIHMLPARLADAGLAVLQVDHVTKDSDRRGRYAIGGQHKLAAITGAAYKLQVIKSFGKGQQGHAKLIIDKDRHSDVGPTGTTAADVHIDATAEDGTLYAWLDVPTQSRDDEGRFRPTVLMQRVSEYLERVDGATGAMVRANVRGKAATIDQAVEALMREGFVRADPGVGQKVHHHLIRPFTDDDSDSRND